MFTCVFRRPKASLRVLIGLLCAVTALSLLTCLRTSSASAQAADLSVSGDPGGWGADNTGASGASKNVEETGAAYGSVTVSGGEGGGGMSPGRGGKGGNASLELSGNDVEVRARNLSVNTRFSMSSGARGDHDGGDAIFATAALSM